MNEVKIISNYRWRIVALLFLATTINYLDRQVIGLLKPTLEDEFHWSETDYSNIVIWFQASYAIGLLLLGKLIDRVGTKIGYTLSVALWSLAAIAHALAKSTLGFFIARGALGISEAGNFPAAIKTVAEWFPKKQRALAAGIFNSGANIGAIVAPASVPLIVLYWGWQWAFILTGAVGFIWLVFWQRMYQPPEKHKKVSEAELQLINSDKEITTAEKITWRQALTQKATYGFLFAKLLTDPVWWFYLFWLPAFLKTQGITGTQQSWPLIAVYSMATVGSIAGGWLSSSFIKNGWTINKSRKTAMLLFALMMLPLLFIRYVDTVTMALVLIGLACGAHQAWSANLFTTVSDQFPKKAVSTIVGIGGMSGSVGGIFFAGGVGKILDNYKAAGNLEAGYNIIFIVCGLAYITALFIFHVLSPKMKIVNL